MSFLKKYLNRFCFLFISVLALTVFTTGCNGTVENTDKQQPPEIHKSLSDSVEIVTSIPVETSLTGCGTRRASDVWLEMIRSAQISLDFGEFYLAGKKGESLDPILDEVFAAAQRGVKIRFLIDKKMEKNSEEVEALLTGKENIEIRKFKWDKGVLHAKYFIVDSKTAFLGSQNFDWRALTHIHETGVLINDEAVVKTLSAIFTADWDTMGGDETAYERLSSLELPEFKSSLLLAASPEGKIPANVTPSIDVLKDMLNSAEKAVTVQLLSYSKKMYDEDGLYNEIEQLLKDTAARGVKIRMLMSNWTKRNSQVEFVKELAAVEGITVKFANIPEFSGGFIPYARVIHSKVLRVDSDRCWVSTSNWGRDYFYASRNLELVMKDKDLCSTLDCLFEEIWTSEYAETVDPEADYESPKIY